MAQRIVVQDGKVLYTAPDPLAVDIDFTINGLFNVTKQVNVGDDINAPGVIETPNTSGADLIIRTHNNGSTFGNIKLDSNTTGGDILLNNISWPDGTVSPVPGMYLGVSGLNTLQFYTLPGALGALRINTQPSDYMLALEDAFNTLIRITKSTPANVIIPNDTTVNMPIGSSVLISWNGTGAVTITSELGVTVDTPDTYVIAARYGKVAAIKTASNHWEIEGNLEPL